MTLIMILLGALAFVGTLVFTKLNFKKAFGVFFACVALGLIIDVFLASYATLMLGYLTQ